MKNLYLEIARKLLSFNRNATIIGLRWLNSCKKGFSFHNRYTELLAIWTILFMIITGFFIIAIKSSVLVMFLLFISAIVIMYAGIITTTYYLYALKYRDKKSLLPKIHNLLNKSFKLRSLFYFIKIPRFSIFNNIVKNFKFAS